MYSKFNLLGFACVFILTNIIFAGEENIRRIENLSGRWKFNIGDNKAWANLNFDDSDWSTIKVPSRWEEKGYNGYNGYAWYRKTFDLSPKYLNQNMFLSLGLIDDVAEIYINGEHVTTSGSFPPKYKTAFSSKIWVPIPRGILKDKNNLISVRVYDGGQAGGIYKGDIGIYLFEPPLDLVYDLKGTWKFKKGDNSKWSKINIDDKNWDNIFVPSSWDVQGYKDYDGFAWYRVTFDVNLVDEIIENDLVLMLGKIDDLDETFLNNKLVGSTGDLIIAPIDGSIDGKNNKDYNKFRGYKFKKDDLRNGKNVIAVRVYDGLNIGGIYQGPIGITSLEEYINYRRNDVIKKKSFIELLFD